jgi:polysaccharide biosynthesis/export protein
VRITFYLFVLFLTSCASYKQNIMFQSTEVVAAEKINQGALEAQKSFIISKSDKLGIHVFSNKGERLIDPNPELSQTNLGNQQTQSNEPSYQVGFDGLVKLPLIGEIKLEGLTQKQAEEVLQKEYSQFFKDPFVQLSFSNKRVIVLGALGGHVIPLTNENTSLAEVLALAKGINNESKAHNMRLMRANKAYEVDFSTIEGFRNGNMLMESGDIVYVEPVRRAFSEGVRENAGILSVFVSLGTLIAILYNLNSNP